MNIAKYRFIILSVLLSLIIFLIYHLIFYTKWQKELKNLTDELKELEAKLASARQAVRDLPMLERKIKSLEYKWELSQRLLPPEEKIDDVIRLITQRAMEAGIKITELKRGAPSQYITKTISPAKTPQRKQEGTVQISIQQVPLDLKIKSNFNSLCEFLSEISTLQRLITTWNTNITSKQEEEYTIEGSLQAKIYIFGGAK
ncbi:MAG: type 4a pilus biogenesis protein PilO [candidate division WOR-3 bacterium]|uniref:Type 4a pilus biogenesis protein PilO n=1 Tax=candidate division WOR-3 bacterium TaxID=2052148 RepID=A0A7V3ZTV5_UNCW3